MAKKTKKIDARVVFEGELGFIIDEDSKKEERTLPQQIRYIVAQYYEAKQ